MKYQMASCSNIESLPYDCVCAILAQTSPLDACKFSQVSPTLVSCADSDIVWKSFLPSDYKDIVSSAVNPSTLNFSSYKQLFYALCHPLLIDHGNKSFKLDKSSGKKSYIISARELSIAWSSDPMMWSWKPTPQSRFAEAVELRTVNWLEIEGKMRTRNLTGNTTYAAYLIMNVSHRAYGLDSVPSEVSVTVGNNVRRGKAYLGHKDEKKRKMETLFYGNRTEVLRNAAFNENIEVARKREDGWMEIELGEFFISGEGDEEINMCLREVGYQLKGGLVLEGIEVRPKTSLHYTPPGAESSLVSSIVKSTADSDAVWDNFLPFNYQEIVSRLVDPSLSCSSKKELFVKLCKPQPIDDGDKMLSIEKTTAKICYLLSARQLSITWGNSPLYWSWKPIQGSRFEEAAELRTICWLEIKGSINSGMLSPKTMYGAYLKVKIADRAYGLDSLPSEVSVEVGNHKSQGTVYIHSRCTRNGKGSCHCHCKREDDDWSEIELGSFYTDSNEQEVRMCLKEIKGVHLKGGLIVDGIEIRPKML